VSSHTRSTCRYAAAATGSGNKLVDDWEREREQHQKTLNGTRFTLASTSVQEPVATQSWPCVDNTSCEIQLSLVEQRQKLMHRKRQALEKLSTSSYIASQNGRRDERMSTEYLVNSVDNKHVDEKSLRSNSSVHSKSQRDFMYDNTEMVVCHDVGSQSFDNGLSRSINFRTNGPPRKPSSDVPAAIAVPDKKNAREHEFEASEEQTRRKGRRLQHLRSSQKTGKLHPDDLLILLSSAKELNLLYGGLVLIGYIGFSRNWG